MAGLWDNYPQNDVVNWPCDEKIIGVLGLAPSATSDFYNRICARPVKKDWEHPRVIIDSNPKIPSRGRCLDLGEADPVPFIKNSIAKLVEQGASVIAVPCNTAHIFYDRYAEPFINGVHPIQVPNIIEITSRAAAKAGAKNALILASNNVVKYQLYQRALQRLGVETLVPSESHQKLVVSAIECIKQFKTDNNIAAGLFDLIQNLQPDCCILGCTELPVFFSNVRFSAASDPYEKLLFIDSNQELADWCIGAV